MDHTTGRLSSKRARALFNNAEGDESIAKAFVSVAKAHAPTVEEVRPEAPRIDPYAEINARNAEMERIRYELALKSDSRQTLLTGPSVQASKSETVALSELPAIVRQAAEAAARSKIMHKK